MIPENKPAPSFFPLFLVSAAAIAFEIQLTRFFSIASWSEYGYWIISIVMVGLSMSGVTLSLFKDFFLCRSAILMFYIPLALMAAASLGFYGVTLVPFNPLELQNRELWLGQLLNVGKYYLVLFPFFFLSGLYIGLNFISRPRQISRLYAFDLVGAAAGSLFLLALMFFIHPFYLMAAWLPLLLSAALLCPSPLSRGKRIGLALVIFLLSEIGVIFLNQADFCEYKAVYPPLHVEGSQIREKTFSPRGLYLVLDDFTERLDIDLSNNYSLLGVDGPPQTYGLYQDGNRLGSLPKTSSVDTRYTKASLDSLPYILRPQSRTLLLGTRGGFKLPELLNNGILQIAALEPDPILYSLLSNPQKYGGAWLSDSRVTLLREPPLTFLKNNPLPFDVIDLSSEFLDQGEANRLAFTQEALQAYVLCLKPGGVVSIPAPIRELTVYALKVLESAREALQNMGVPNPESHLLLYRSAWNSRILIFKDPIQPVDLKHIRAFCSDRSFDISYYEGIKPGAQEIWNEIPPLSFAASPSPKRSREAQDALLDDSLKLLSNDSSFYKNYFFNLKPSTWDRPFFYSVIRPSNLGLLLNHLALIPREEIGYLVNLAVLIQSLLFALLILALPLFGSSRKSLAGFPAARMMFYFAALGLGFLFIEITLIEKASTLLGDKTLAFSMVLCGMLFFSGIGSWFAANFSHRPQSGLKLALGIILPWLALSFLFLNPLLSLLLPWGIAAKSVMLLLLLAPLSFGLGMPFSLGLSSLKQEQLSFIPWAWALNGAFSVAATPLANWVAVSSGYSRLLGLGLLLYLLVGLSFSKTK